MEAWKETAILRGYAKNSDEWWVLIDHNWTNFARLIDTYLTQEEQEAARIAKNRKNGPALHLHLQRVWDRMPDSGWVQQVPGFGALCDVCSDFHG